MTPREEIYRVIDGERYYQDKKWGGEANDKGMDVTDWLDTIFSYMDRAEMALSPEEVLEELRKVVALGIACFEYHGVPRRSIVDEKK